MRITRSLPLSLAAIALAMVSCQLAPVSLPVKGDAGDVDDDTDETLVPCSDASMCAGLDDEKLCHPELRYCVECVTTADCRNGRSCDDEFECDGPRN